jgi:hypothetical protein
MNPAPKPEKRPKRKANRLSHRRDGIEKECDDLWRDCVYLRANFKSEMSGHPGWNDNGERVAGLNAHHIAKKSNHWLRYSLRNGMCLLEFEHLKLHYEASPSDFEKRSILLVGAERWEQLQNLARDNEPQFLPSVRDYLIKMRNFFIDQARKSGDTYLLDVYLKQRAIKFNEEAVK